MTDMNNEQRITGTSSTNHNFVREIGTETTGTSGNIAEMVVKELSTCRDGHCGCSECEGREDIINKVWKEYCILKDMAKWYRSQLNSMVIEMPGCRLEIPEGADPILALILAYRDMALDGKSPYDGYEPPAFKKIEKPIQ